MKYRTSDLNIYKSAQALVALSIRVIPDMNRAIVILLVGRFGTIQSESLSRLAMPTSTGATSVSGALTRYLNSPSQCRLNLKRPPASVSFRASSGAKPSRSSTGSSGRPEHGRSTPKTRPMRWGHGSNDCAQNESGRAPIPQRYGHAHRRNRRTSFR